MSENLQETKPASAVTQKDIRNAMWRHLITLQWSWNYERMQALGFLYSMLPILRKVYPGKEEFVGAMKRHLQFYNTNPQVGSPPIFGAAVALEADRLGETVDSLKIGLMGPFAGIGDTLQGVLVRPLIAVFAASIALAGSWVGPLLMFLVGLAWCVLMVPLFYLGYRRGVGLVEDATGGLIDKITNIANVFGVMVVGGFIPSILAGVKSPLTFKKTIEVAGKAQTQSVPLQDTLDKILPYMIPVAIVALSYWLIRRFKLSPIWVLIILVIVGFGTSAIGLL